MQNYAELLNGHAAYRCMDGSVVWSYTDKHRRPSSAIVSYSDAIELIEIQEQIRTANALVRACV